VSFSLPNLPGTYALWLEMPERTHLAIGRLGEFDFPPGGYLYLGSAFGTGGLAGRLHHHLSPIKRPHWHIDYLRPKMRITALGYCVSENFMECQWSRRAARHADACVPAPGFGASDCLSGCAAHLYLFSSQASFALAAGLLHDPPMIWVDLSKIE
jgi:Uri superfamily endonuclease